MDKIELFNINDIKMYKNKYKFYKLNKKNLLNYELINSYNLSYLKLFVEESNFINKYRKKKLINLLHTYNSNSMYINNLFKKNLFSKKLYNININYIDRFTNIKNTYIFL